MFVILALVAVIGGWGGHQRIQDRIEARAAMGANAESVPAAPPGLAVEVIAPDGVGPVTINALSRRLIIEVPTPLYPRTRHSCSQEVI